MVILARPSSPAQNMPDSTRPLARIGPGAGSARVSCSGGRVNPLCHAVLKMPSLAPRSPSAILPVNRVAAAQDPSRVGLSRNIELLASCDHGRIRSNHRDIRVINLPPQGFRPITVELKGNS